MKRYNFVSTTVIAEHANSDWIKIEQSNIAVNMDCC